MKMNSIIFRSLKKNNNVIITVRVMELGFSRYLLSKYEKEGLLERKWKGVYVLPNSVHDDMYTLMLCSEKIIFWHNIALFLHGLSERIPFVHSVTIPNNTRLSKIIQEECVCYYIKSELHQIGMTIRKTILGNEVRCYNAERTIYDLLRLWNRLDEETVIGAVKNYAKSLNIAARVILQNYMIEKFLKKCWRLLQFIAVR